MAGPDRSQEPQRSGGSWLLRVYELISVTPDDVLADARGLGIQVATVDELRSVRTSVLDGLAEQYIRNTKLMTSLSGAGLGAAGLFAVGPDVTILAASLLRLAQRLAIVYGFDFRKPAESLHVWAAIARALGVEKVTDGASTVAVRNLPKLLAQGAQKSGLFKTLIRMIAARLGLLVTERGLARALPLVGAGVAAVTNYQLVRDLGAKIQGYFRERHVTWKVERGNADPVPDSSRGPGAPDAEGDDEDASAAAAPRKTSKKSGKKTGTKKKTTKRKTA